jgi:molybdopterin adenylyltransferase
MSVHEHRRQAPAAPIEVHVLVASTTRDLSQDRSGLLIAERLTAAGHQVGSRQVVDDDQAVIRSAVVALADRRVPVIILTGGTGLAGRDVTPEAVEPLLTRRIEGFGELFRFLSFQEVGAAAMLSRAFAGMIGQTVIFALPGSSAACGLAMDRLILPELGHLVHLAHANT